MNLVPSVPLRYVVSPTVQEIYKENTEGWEASKEEDTMIKLSNENDRVDGMESVYGFILSNRRRVNLSGVVGNEGFVSTIKETVSKTIQAIKDFFKWIWSFFGSKKKAIDNKLEKTTLALDNHGVTGKDLPYPKSIYCIYPTASKPSESIDWLHDAITRVVKAVAKALFYVDKLETFITGAKMTLDLEGLFEHLEKHFTDTVTQAFNNGKIVNFLGVDVLEFKDGKINYALTGLSQEQLKDATFNTSTSQVKEYTSLYKTLQSRLNELSKDIHALENDLIKLLESRLKALNNQKDPIIAKVRDVVQKSMSNIKTLQTQIFRAAEAIVDVCTAATKG